MFRSSLFFPLLSLAFVARATPDAAIGDYIASGIGLSSTATPTQASTNGSDECYASWETYWSESYAAASASWGVVVNGSQTVGSAITTITSTELETYSAVPSGVTTIETIIHTVNMIVNGGFTISTQSIDTTSSTVITQTSIPATTETYVNTDTSFASVAAANMSGTEVPPKPSCKLPGVVPDCQTSWEAYVSTALYPSPTPPPHCDINAGFLQNTNTVPPCVTSYSAELDSYSKAIGANDNGYINTPICTAASISGAQCQSVRDAYQEGSGFRPTAASQAMFFNQGTLGVFDGFNTSWTWPTSSTLGYAPSCTLGCGRCAVTGGTVQLIYWPATSTQAPIANATAAPAAPVTVETLGTTFTSPTLYISYSKLYAENACGTTGTEIGETILAIPTDKPLSSVYAGTIPCDAHFRPTLVVTGTAPFTVEDMNSPVPYSIYSSQPWCQTNLRNQGCTGTCPTTAPYNPILVVDNDLLRGLQSDWADCWGDIRGVYDPPIALTQVKSEVKPQNTYGADGNSPQATPGTGPAPNNAAPTATAAPDNVPGQSNGIAVPVPPKASEGQGSAQYQDQPASGTGGIVVPTPPKPSQGAESAQTQNPPALNNAPAVATVGSQHFTIGPIAGQDGAVEVANGKDTQTVAPGGSAVTMGSQVISAGSAGYVVVGTGNAAVTVTANPAPSPDVQPVVATVGSQHFTISKINGQSSVLGVVNGDASQTLTPGGAAITMDGQVISAGSSGDIVVGTGRSATTIPAGSVSSSQSSSTQASSSRPVSRASTTAGATQASQRGAADRMVSSLGFVAAVFLLGVLFA